ncbi:MAG: MFS transporter [Dehalococcoidia bacterium]|nr:MAG: MFS transporter [Dehalococcoidia bacterium]
MTGHDVRQSPSFSYSYVIVIMTFIIAAVVEGSMFSFGIFFEPLLNEFGWTRAVTSGAVSLSSIIHIPIAIAAGKLADRFGSKQILAACGFFLGLGYLLMSQTAALWHLYIFYGAAVGVGMGLYWIPLVSVVPQWFVRRRALMMAIIASGIGVGQLTFPPLVNWLISVYGWRTAFVILGGLIIGIIMISAQFIRHAPSRTDFSLYGESQKASASTSVDTEGFSFIEAIRTRHFWILCLIYLSWLFCLSSVIVHSVIHAIGVGISPANAANILAIVGVTGIIGRLVSGRLADKIGMKPVLMVSFVLMSLIFLWLMISGELWMIYLFAAIFGISYGTFEILQSPITASLFGLSSLGTIFGVIHAFGSIGVITGPVLVGLIFDVTNSYQLAFLVCAAMAFVSLISTVFLPLKQDRIEQDSNLEL